MCNTYPLSNQHVPRPGWTRIAYLLDYETKEGMQRTRSQLLVICESEQLRLICMSIARGPSIYDVHTEEEGVRLRWTHVDGGGGQAPCERPHRKLKLESTDIILSPSHARHCNINY